MKKYFLILCVLLTTVVSCSKDDDTNPNLPNTQLDGNIEWTLDGVEQEGETIYRKATYDEVKISEERHNFYIEARDFMVFADSSSFTWNNSNATLTFGFSDGVLPDTLFHTGQIIIRNFDINDYIEGEFECSDAVIVDTNGETPITMELYFGRFILEV